MKRTKTESLVRYTKAQMKVQQMAFLLVAITIFFAMVILIYFSITFSGVKSSAITLQDEEAKAMVRKLAGSPEFTFTASTDCSSCIDLDKLVQITRSNSYDSLWNVEHLFIERISPEYPPGECSTLPTSYPDNCDEIVLVKKSEEYSTKTAFVTLVRWDDNKGVYKYEFGRLHVSPRKPKEP